jgi:predicted nucleic acid-binding protein
MRQGQAVLAWTRLVVAAVAARHGATVLHNAGDFELIATVTGQPATRIAVPGQVAVG